MAIKGTFLYNIKFRKTYLCNFFFFKLNFMYIIEMATNEN